MYKVKIIPSAQDILNDLKKSNSKAYSNVVKKIDKIAELLEYNPDHCKNLKKPMQDYKRVHVNDSFVLIFKVDKRKKIMTIYNYRHHDLVYKV